MFKKAAFVIAGLLTATQPSFASPPDVFGSVAIKLGNVSIDEKWLPIQKEIDACVDGSCFTPEFKKFLAGLKGKTFKDQLEAINLHVNQIIKYKNDVDDEWTGPGETLARGYGDCEDYAILKLTALRNIGIDSQYLAMVVVNFKGTDGKVNYHAVTTVSTNFGYQVLDIVTNAVYNDSTNHVYFPLYSFSDNAVYIAGRKVSNGN
jgi:predicted transglutaminase-like cysteine proteinase